MDRWIRHLIRQCWRRGSYLGWETEDFWMTCGCSTMGHPHTSLFLYAMFWTNILQDAGLAVAHWHLRYHYHGHHIVLTLPHQTIRCRVLSREKVAARRYNNNKDLRRAVEDAFRTITPKMLRRMSQRTWRHIRLCPESRCTYGFTGHVIKAYVSDSNQIMVAYWSVYGDFSPNLCVCVCVCVYIWYKVKPKKYERTLFLYGYFEISIFGCCSIHVSMHC